MNLSTKYFEKAGKVNTHQTLELVKVTFETLKIKTIVVASTTGESAFQAATMFKDDPIRLIIVKHMDGFRHLGNEFSLDTYNEILRLRPSTLFFTGTHAFAGIERTFRLENISQTMLPIEMIAITLRRCFGEGTKVALEIALMVADGGLLENIEQEIITVAGTGRGLDTAWIVTPSYTNNLFNLKMKAPICKPINF
jgi:hypothetical protein